MVATTQGKPTDINLSIKVRLKAGIKYDDDANVFVAYAPALDLYSQGTTELKARSALKDAIPMFLSAVYRKNMP